LTAGVNKEIGKINSSLEELLTNEQFIQKWGSVFAIASGLVTKALAFITRNIEILSTVLIAFVP
jgi:hypothetical protein